MSKHTVTQIKTATPVTTSNLVELLGKSMNPIFAHFERELAKGGDKALHIRVAVKGKEVKLSYGVSDD